MPRRDQQFHISQLLPRIKSALAKTKRESEIVPLIEPETVRTSKIALSQHCFWTGELAIGSVPGVIKTEAGWLDGREVTLAHFDPKQVTAEEVIKQAKAQSCADKVYQGSALSGYRPARQSDQKKQLQGTRFDKVRNLTAYQKTKINAFARTNPGQAAKYLSPRQLKTL